MDLMNIEELADYLQCTVQTARKKMKEPGAPRGFNPAGRILFDRADVDSWIRGDDYVISKLSDEYRSQDGSELDPAPIEFFTDADIDLAEEVICGIHKVEDLSPEWVANILDKVVTLALLQKCGQPFPVMGPVPDSLKGRVYDREADWASRGEAAQ